MYCWIKTIWYCFCQTIHLPLCMIRHTYSPQASLIYLVHVITILGIKNPPQLLPSQSPSVINRLLHAEPVSQPCAILSQLSPSKPPITTEEKLPFHQTKNHNPTWRKTNQRLTNASKNTTRQLLHAKCVSFTPIFCRTRQVIRTLNSLAKTTLTNQLLHAKLVSFRPSIRNIVHKLF